MTSAKLSYQPFSVAGLTRSNNLDAGLRLRPLAVGGASSSQRARAVSATGENSTIRGEGFEASSF